MFPNSFVHVNRRSHGSSHNALVSRYSLPSQFSRRQYINRNLGEEKDLNPNEYQRAQVSRGSDSDNAAVQGRGTSKFHCPFPPKFCPSPPKPTHTTAKAPIHTTTAPVQIPSTKPAPSPTPSPTPTALPNPTPSSPEPTTNPPPTASSPSPAAASAASPVSSAVEQIPSQSTQADGGSASATQSSPASDASGASVSSSVLILLSVSTKSDGQITSVPIATETPFTTKNGTPLIISTDAQGSTITVPFGADPTQTAVGGTGSVSGIDAGNSPTNGTGAAAKSNHVGAVAGGIVGALFFILLLIGIFVHRRRRNKGHLAPSAEFLAPNSQRAFSGSPQFQFRRIGSSYESSGIDRPSMTQFAQPSRENSPQSFLSMDPEPNEKYGSSY